jgi:regulator of protease activity HflC (stomatin/prohibitin superfamily)
MVLEADGRREAGVREAEGERQAAVLKAQGDREASILRAAGFALALQKIFEVAEKVDSKTMSLQYLETLKALGAGSATKLVIPAELSNLLQPFFDHNAKASR